MALFRCKMCGGDLDVNEGLKVVECDFCNTKQTLPSMDNEKKINLFNRANRLRFANEFDKAASLYENIVAEFPEEAEAYWGLCLCKYGIEYVDDPTTAKKVPTCHRTSLDGIFDDSNFELALEYADSVAVSIYREEAKEIDRLQKKILEIANREEPFDIFICYKETAEDGQRTKDSVLAQDMYDRLTEKGYKVFFARITLEDKLGQEYEPYIFSALNSAKIMLAVGTKYEYYNAVWVKNEWSRFLDMMKTDKEKVLIPCYADIDAYDMPQEFKNIQGQDMGKVGFLQDLVRGIGKIISIEKHLNNKSNCEENEGKSSNENSKVISDYEKQRIEEGENKLEQGILCLEDEDWEGAYYYFNEADIDIDESNSKYVLVYLGRLCAQLHLCTIDEFKEGTPMLVEDNGIKDFKASAEVKAGFYCLEHGWWDSAVEFFDEATNINVKYAIAYIGKMMADYEIYRVEDISGYFWGNGIDIKEDKNYIRALKFAEPEYRKTIESYDKKFEVIEEEQQGKSEKLREIRNNQAKYKKCIVATRDNTFALSTYGSVFSAGSNDVEHLSRNIKKSRDISKRMIINPFEFIVFQTDLLFLYKILL